MSQWYKLVNSSGTTVLYEQGYSLVAVVEKAVLEQKNLGGIVFDYMNLAGGVFAGAKMAACSFKGANLAGCNFTGSTLTTCHFEGANCVGTNFTSADLTNADFSGALVTEATWTTATLTGVDKDAAATDSDATTATTATATPAANAIAKANSAGKLLAGWGGAASTLATLNGSIKVVEDPANATATPTASKIPMTGAGGAFLAEGWRRPTPTAYDFATAVPYVVLATDEALDVTSGAVSDDVDLPTAVGCAGRTISIKKVDAGAGVIAVDPNGVEHIEGLGAGNPYNLTAQYQGVTLRSDGTKWHVVTSTTTTAGHADTHLNAGTDPVRLTVRTPAAGACAIATTDHYVRVDSAGAGAVAATLYAADAAAVGRVVTVVKVDAAADDVNVTPAGVETINGVAAAYTLAAQWNTVTLLCVAVGQWEIVSAN
jgi:hypothetical protein